MEGDQEVNHTYPAPECGDHYDTLTRRYTRGGQKEEEEKDKKEDKKEKQQQEKK